MVMYKTCFVTAATGVAEPEKLTSHNDGERMLIALC